jgi:hypothetical protein
MLAVNIPECYQIFHIGKKKAPTPLHVETRSWCQIHPSGDERGGIVSGANNTSLPFAGSRSDEQHKISFRVRAVNCSASHR